MISQVQMQTLLNGHVNKCITSIKHISCEITHTHCIHVYDDVDDVVWLISIDTSTIGNRPNDVDIVKLKCVLNNYGNHSKLNFRMYLTDV